MALNHFEFSLERLNTSDVNFFLEFLMWKKVSNKLIKLKCLSYRETLQLD